MKALLTAAIIALLAAAAVPASAGEPQEKKVRKIVRVERHAGGAWLGVALKDVAKDVAGEQKRAAKEGAFVTEVVDESPADSAGFKEGDVIIELNGKPVATSEDVVKRIGEMKPGETAALVVLRDGDKKSISVKLAARPEHEARMEMRMPPMNMEHMGMGGMTMPPMFNVESRIGVEGMRLMELTDQLGAYFQAPDGKALLVTNVKKNSNARKAGIETGDVIVKIGTTDIEDMSDLHAALKDAKAGGTVDVQLLRKGARKTVKLEVSKDDNQMMMNFRGAFPFRGNFNFDHSGFDPERLRSMMDDLKPELDRIRKDVRIRIHDGKVIKEESETPEEEEHPGTEL